MTRRIAIPLAAAVIALGLCSLPGHTAPETNTWLIEQARKPDGTAPLFTDTLPRFAADSVKTTDSVSVFAARAIFVTIQSSGSDSMAIPTIQVRHAGGQWVGTGASMLTMSQTTNVTTTTAVTQATRSAVYYLNEISASGTPFPIINDYVRWRLRSTNVRLYNAASQATLAPQGTITVRVFVVR